tara:strand:- start:4731 stop:5696 length:966 start_codon:yes stop_codon:yes gene_type:complete
MKILLTGGLGYIGSHIANLLGKRAVIIDNQVNSSLDYKKFLPEATYYNFDLNSKLIDQIFLDHKIEGVIHLAALKAVNESLKNPINYYKNNICSSINLLETMKKYKVQKIVFSSSATVYGDKNESPLKENMNLEAINPYGRTKIIIENLLKDYAKSEPNFKSIVLRYFNPIGADIKAGLLEQPLGKPQNIIPSIIKSIKEKKTFKIYGNNYKTKDGTCIRDYIHVKDLAVAHILALKKLKILKNHNVINLGLGKGASVLEIVKLFEKINKIKVNYRITNRRKGDVAISYADNKIAKKVLGWKPKYDHIEMVRDAWQSYLNK